MSEYNEKIQLELSGECEVKTVLIIDDSRAFSQDGQRYR
jgi:hypothetical protein